MSAIDYLRTAGIPQMMYGCDATGMSNTTLEDAVRVCSKLVAPPTAGKNPLLVMHAMKVHSDAIDPRVAGNTAPITSWATAWWDNWATGDELLKAFRSVTANAGTAREVMWGTVSGPCKALVATCQRLGWTTSNGRVFRDDIGVEWDVAVDPPQAVNAAAKRTVARTNLDGVLKELPMAAPTKDDIQHHSSQTARLRRLGCRTSLNVDLTPYLKPLFKGGKRCLKHFSRWEPECAGYLTSATSGGQWPQTRKAKLPGVDPSALCQLCLAAKGTLAHRHCCSTTRPSNGWVPCDPEVQAFAAKLGDDRLKTLAERAVLTVAIPIPAPQTETPQWQWVTAPPDCNKENLRWVVDGSRRYTTEWSLATTGCGVAVLNGAGDLVAYAWATPPAWVKTSGMAETWAVLLTLRWNLAPPAIITDCLGVLNMAQAGARVATSARNPTARIWREIVDLSGGDLRQLRASLVWMPSHESAESASSTRNSAGRIVSVPEWRANQLADILAKRGAGTSALRDAADKTIKLAGKTLCHHGAQLGLVTRAANKHRVEYTDKEGKPAFKFIRDSTPLEKQNRREKIQPARPKPVLPDAMFPPLPATSASANAEHRPPGKPSTTSLQQDKSLAASMQTRDRKRKGHERTGALVQELAQTFSPQAIDAATRMEAIRARLNSRRNLPEQH